LFILACSFSSGGSEKTPETQEAVSSSAETATENSPPADTESATELSPPADSDILFQDDFSDTSGDWGKVFETEGTLANYQDQGYRIFVNKAEYFVWGVSAHTFTGDLSINVDAVFQNSPPQGYVGLICHYTKEQEQERFYILAVSDGASFIAKADGDIVMLADDAYDAQWKTGETLRLRAECKADSLSLYVDDELVINAVDDDILPEGDIGLSAGTFTDQVGTDVFFDNIEIKKINEQASVNTEPVRSIDSAYTPVPRWMLVGQAPYDINLAGEDWLYKTDNWNESVACIRYAKDGQNNVWVEQCFADREAGYSLDGLLAPYLDDGFEALVANDNFDNVGQIALVAKYMEDDSSKYIRAFQAVDVNGYILTGEMVFETEKTTDLQSFYESQIAHTLNYIFRSGLGKAHLIPAPAPTPLSPAQGDLYSALNNILITETEASALYYVPIMGGGVVNGRWEARSDDVSAEAMMVCRNFEDRSPEDVQWVSFSNCVFKTENVSFDDIVDAFTMDGDISITSQYQYDGDLKVFGYQDGHSFIYALLNQGEYVYFIWLDARTLKDEKIEQVYAQEMDDFFHAVLLTNLEHTAQ
jgi:hypothetical protein